MNLPYPSTFELFSLFVHISLGGLEIIFLPNFEQGDAKGSARGGDGSAKGNAVGAMPGPSSQV